MKRIMLFVLLFCLPVFTVSASSQQSAAQRHEEALKVYGAANACLATYDDRVGNIFYHFLQYEGWKVERHDLTDKVVDTNVFLASRHDAATGENIYLLSFRGTTSSKDRAINRRTRLVWFNGNSLEEFHRYALETDIPQDAPRVHEGFLSYALSALELGVVRSEYSKADGILYEIIKNDPKARLIITGHSLGGAVATIYAASIIELGVPTEQIQVITFGAPAVGNMAFAQRYEPQIDLLRIYSPFDPIPGGLQTIRSGYRQFGRPLVLSADIRRKTIQHSMESYADMVGKYFYDQRAEAIAAGELAPMPLRGDEGDGPVVAVYLSSAGNDHHLPDHMYLRENLLDIYRRTFLRYRIIDDAGENPNQQDLVRLAKEQGADYLLNVNIGLTRHRYSQDWIVSLSQSVLHLEDNALQFGVVYSSRVRLGGSFFQASAYNVFRAVKDLQSRGVEWVIPSLDLPEEV